MCGVLESKCVKFDEGNNPRSSQHSLLCPCFRSVSDTKKTKSALGTKTMLFNRRSQHKRMQYETPVPKGEPWLQRLPLSNSCYHYSYNIVPDNFNLEGFKHIHHGLLLRMFLEMLYVQIPSLKLEVSQCTRFCGIFWRCRRCTPRFDRGSYNKIASWKRPGVPSLHFPFPFPSSPQRQNMLHRHRPPAKRTLRLLPHPIPNALPAKDMPTTNYTRIFQLL